MILLTVQVSKTLQSVISEYAHKGWCDLMMNEVGIKIIRDFASCGGKEIGYFFSIYLGSFSGQNYQIHVLLKRI